jgi:alpha-D-ribose 1-methylphosphonate 5-triphosphate synthase subunit PhnL
MPVTRSTIDEIKIQNFKFFPKLDQSIKVDGKHLLLYGENGSGKSSIYWALYTLLECSNKSDIKEIKKYFDFNDEERLINVHIKQGTTNWVDPFVEVTLKDGTAPYRISYTDTAINTNTEAQESNFSSDFINYRNLLNLYNFAHSEDVDLIGFFNYAVFPYVKFTDVKIGTKSVGGVTEDVFEKNANKLFKLVNDGPKKDKKTIQGKDRFPIQKEQEFADYYNIVEGFRSGLDDLLTYIKTEGNEFLKKDLGFNFGFDLQLDWERHLKPSKRTLNPGNDLITVKRFPNTVIPNKDFSKYPFFLTEQGFSKPQFKIWLSITDYENERDVVRKPHSFLNEARLTALGLSIRLAVLKRSLSEDAKLKILVLDDLLISLDMSNREKVLKLVFEKYIDKYQVLILTHDKMFYEFVKLYIRQKSKLADWQITELYAGKDKTTGNGYPVLIEGDFGYFEKAQKYFEAKDYTACALYIRKELESLVIERLPDEYHITIDGKFKDLAYYWERCVERYQKLAFPITADIKESFEQTKLMLLNPQAHHDLFHPVYKLELEKAFKLIADIKTHCPIPESIILLSKGMKLKFKHPTQNYTFDFELLSDFSVEGLNGATTTVLPKCKVSTWQFNGTDFWDFTTSKAVVLRKPIEQSLKQIIDTHTSNFRVPLAITQDMFVDNTTLTNGIWTLKEVINKSGAII